MNNNEFNFDPQTGQPIQANNLVNNNGQDAQINQQNIPIVEQGNQQVNVQSINSNEMNSINPIIQMQNIPTVDQPKQEFINNTESIVNGKKEVKKGGINYFFVFALFIILFATIYFLFPILIKYI